MQSINQTIIPVSRRNHNENFIFTSGENLREKQDLISRQSHGFPSIFFNRDMMDFSKKIFRETTCMSMIFELINVCKHLNKDGVTVKF